MKCSSTPASLVANQIHPRCGDLRPAPASRRGRAPRRRSARIAASLPLGEGHGDVLEAAHAPERTRGSAAEQAPLGPRSAARAASPGVSPYSITHAPNGSPPMNMYQPPESWARGPVDVEAGGAASSAARRSSSVGREGLAAGRRPGSWRTPPAPRSSLAVAGAAAQRRDGVGEGGPQRAVRVGGRASSRTGAPPPSRARPSGRSISTSRDPATPSPARRPRRPAPPASAGGALTPRGPPSPRAGRRATRGRAGRRPACRRGRRGSPGRRRRRTPPRRSRCPAGSPRRRPRARRGG